MQEEIDPYCIDLCLACLLHYDGDLANDHCYIGGEHVGAHCDPDTILSCISHLLAPDDATHLYYILTDGCPAYINATGTQCDFQ